MKYLVAFLSVTAGLALAEPNDVACPTVTTEILPRECDHRCARADCMFLSTVQNPCGCPAAIPTATLIYPCGDDVRTPPCCLLHRRSLLWLDWREGGAAAPCSQMRAIPLTHFSLSSLYIAVPQQRLRLHGHDAELTLSRRHDDTAQQPQPQPPSISSALVAEDEQPIAIAAKGGGHERDVLDTPPHAHTHDIAITGSVRLPDGDAPTTPGNCAPLLRCPVPNCAFQEVVRVPCGCDGPRTVLRVQECPETCPDSCITRTRTVSATCAPTDTDEP